MAAWPALAALAQKAGQSTLGEATTYTPSGGSPESVTGIFDGVSVEVDLNTGELIQSTEPFLTVRLADLAVAPTVGDAITVRTIGYTIAEIHPDGQGDARLKLQET